MRGATRPCTRRPPLSVLFALTLFALWSSFAGCGARPGEYARARPDPVAEPAACNGSPVLCARRYDEVVYPTAHNAMSNEDDGWFFPNQRHGIARSLRDGVRALMLDVHYYRGRAYLCHGLCELGRRPLDEGLYDVARFLDRHPAEVVTILFESHVATADVVEAMEDTGLDDDAYVHAPGTPWPTLCELVAGGRRLVVFAEAGGGAPAWYHPLWSFAEETPYQFRQPTEFSCAQNRGAAGGGLFILNHFLSNPLPDRTQAPLVNGAAVLANRARACMARRGHVPNFLAVDFYDLGDVFAVAAALNGTAAP